jgi:hypothetical protein
MPNNDSDGIEGDPTAALTANLRAECRRRVLPEPAVTPIDVQALSGIGLGGGLAFPWKNRYLGGGPHAGAARHRRAVSG